MRIEIDRVGYPTDASVEALAHCVNPREALDAVAEYLTDCGYGRATVADGSTSSPRAAGVVARR